MRKLGGLLALVAMASVGPAPASAEVRSSVNGEPIIPAPRRASLRGRASRRRKLRRRRGW